MSEQFKQQINKWTKRYGMKSKKKGKSNPKSEKLTQSDLDELMGINRPTYKRGKGGAYKQK